MATRVASHGFDHRERLEGKASVPPEQIFDKPAARAARLRKLARPYLLQ